MKLSEYIKDKINYILALATYIIIISTYLKAINLAYSTIFIVIFITCTYFIVAFLISYYKTSKYLKNIEKIAQNTFNMGQPSKSQTIYINLEQSNEVKKVRSGNSIIDAVKNFFSGIVEYFA